ncbi:ankyrin repeat domain-containing protein [Wolbachia endosymbiont (group A) of Myopa testacea]|uniref:ankyrin repeat domain-containing protein n=1 Tax=Wolbachia endosymbiont (group A) of Myopa testacea TaxID=3066148 RepID=UPI0031329EBB
MNSEECSAQDKNAVRETFDYTDAGFRTAKREKDQALKKLVKACKARSDAIETKWKKKREDLWNKETEEAEKAWEEVVEEKALEMVKGEVRELQEKFTRELDKYFDIRAAGINGVSETKGGCLGVASSVGQSSKEKLEVWCNAYKEKNRLSDMLKILGCAKKEAEYEEFKARKEANDDGIEEIVEEGVEESDVKSGRSEFALVAVQKVLDAKIEVEKTKQTGKGKFEARLRLREELAKARKAIMKEETASKFEASLNEAGITGEEVSKKVDELQKLEENEEKNKKLRYISTIKDKKQLYVAYYAMVKDRSALLNWHEKIAKSYDGYKVCSTIKESSFNTEVSNESILGSTVSDVIFLEGSGFASGGEGGDLYIFSARNVKQDLNYFIEVDNGAKDKELDILEMPIIPEATVYGCHLLLGQLNNTYIKIRDYFLSDEYRHLVLMDGKRERFFVPSAQGKRSCDKIVEGTWEAPDIQSVQFIPFYHATSKRNFYNVTEDQMRSHQMIAIGAHLNNTSFYRVHDNLVLMETNKDKNLTVNLPGFFQKGSTDLYFYPDNCQLNLTEVDQLVTAIPMSNTNFFRYYQVSKEGLEIYHNQPTNKRQIGLMDLKSRSILDCSVEIIGRDLILSFGGKAIATVKNWSIYQPARKMMFAFSNTAVFNGKCVVSTCNPEGTVKEFEKEKAKLVSKYNSSLLKAAKDDNLDQFRGLLGRGADVNAKDRGNWTSLHYAAMSNNLEVAKLLIERGADVNAKDHYNKTPLHWAAMESSFDVAKLLIERGADTSATDATGKTPLDLARPGSKVESFLREKQDERLIQRRRRHHHGDHSRHHDREQKYLQEGERPIHLKSKGASRSIENDNSAIESNKLQVQQASHLYG